MKANTIIPLSLGSTQEELRPICVSASIGHWKDACTVTKRTCTTL